MEPSSNLPTEDLAKTDTRRENRRLGITIAIVVLLTALAILWFATPLREWAGVPHLVAFLRRFGDSPLAGVVILGLFVAGGLVVMPVNLLIAVTILVLGPMPGVFYALVGCELNAIVLYEIGRRIPHGDEDRRLASRVRRLRAIVSEHGVLAVALVRLVPIAPYSIVNVVAGAAHVHRVRYVIGTALGMLPGIIINAFFIDRVVAVIERPGPLTGALLVAAALLAAAFVVLVRRRLAQRDGGS